MQVKMIALAAALSVAPGLLYGQFDFKLAGRDVQVHSFASQGFTFSNDNNYLTMDTSSGTFAFTDGGANVSSRINDKLRVGAQMYFRNVGHLGNYQPQLDWAVVDYKFKDWFGVRAGKVKTMMGLFNDTQDMESLHTWALLPQAVYPLDLRSRSLAHRGGDIYGQIGLSRAGSLDYTAYAGFRSDDPNDGYHYSNSGHGSPIYGYYGRMEGVDLRWYAPLAGLMLGGSGASILENENTGTTRQPNTLNYKFNTRTKWTAAIYGEYSRGKWRFDGEYRRNLETANAMFPNFNQYVPWSDRGWFVSAAYRVTSRLELGTYHTRFYVDDPSAVPPPPSTNHIYDQTIAARFDITRFWSAKVEGHFIDGTGDVWSSHGFYLQDSVGGLKPRMNLLVVRTGFTF